MWASPRPSTTACVRHEVTFGFGLRLTQSPPTRSIRLHTTAAIARPRDGHRRIIGPGTTGWIALHSGIAGGADVILIPEIPFTIETMCERLRERAASGKKFSLRRCG